MSAPCSLRPIEARCDRQGLGGFMGHTCSYTVEEVLQLAREELHRATKKHGPMRGAHEGYAVILEELDELWAAIKEQRPNRDEIQKEAVQVAAMALRFLMDVCRG